MINNRTEMIIIICMILILFFLIYKIFDTRREGFYPTQPPKVYPYPSGNINNNYMSGEGISSQANNRTYMRMDNLPNSFGKDVAELGKDLCPTQTVFCISGNKYKQPPSIFDAYGNELKFASIFDIPSQLKYVYILCQPLTAVNDLNNLDTIYIETTNNLPFQLSIGNKETSKPITDITNIENIADRSIWKVSL